MGRRRLRLVFGRELVTEPIIHQLGRNFEVVTNIRRANVSRDEGWVILELTGTEEELERAIAHLESKQVRVEAVEGDIIQ